MNTNPHHGDAEHENNEAPSSSIPSDEIKRIVIIFPSPRYAMQPVAVQALMDESKKVSKLSYNLAAKIRNSTGVLIEMDLGIVELKWYAVGTILQYMSTFEVVEEMDVDVILGERDCNRLEQARNIVWVGGSINSYYCHTSPAERTRQELEAAARMSKNDEAEAEALRIMNEKDRKRREKALLEAKSSQGRNSGSQQGSNQNS